MDPTADERGWLDACLKALEKQHPGVVERLVLYGSKARGEGSPKSDLDLLLIVRMLPRTSSGMRRIGDLLAATSDTVPSILVYTQDEWAGAGKAARRFIGQSSGMA